MKMVEYIPIFLVIISSIMLLGCNEIFAAEVQAHLDATVFIKQIFEVSATPLSIDFGEVDPGPNSTTATKTLNVSCSTNNNNSWEVSITLGSPLTCGILTIPNENFRWEGSSSGSGKWYAGTGYLDTTPHIFYSASINEYITFTPIESTMRLYVNIPPGQPAGTYSAIMYLKMKDTVTHEEVTSPVDISLKVKPKFTLSVFPSNLEFGKVAPGQITESKILHITCSTNNNRPWSVSFQVISELTSGVAIIPNENFHWQLEETGYGKSMSTSPYTFYKANIDEYITYKPVEFNLKFYVDVPPTQSGGRYTTTLVLTMTEDIGEPTPPRLPPR